MLSVDTYKIDLRVQPEDISETVHYVLNQDFFNRFEEGEIQGGLVHADVSVKGIMGTYRFHISLKGEVVVPCDRCLDPMTQPVEGEQTLKVRLGDTYDETDELLTLAEDDGIFDLGWAVYETIVLALPIMHTHPEAECNAEMMERYNEHRSIQAPDEA